TPSRLASWYSRRGRVSKPGPSVRRARLDQPVAPFVEAVAGARAEEEQAGRGIHIPDVVHQLLQVEVEGWEQVDLVDDDDVARPEHHRVLQRLLLALGHRGDHRPRMLTDVELRRAHEVADVLDHEQVEVAER